MKHPAITIPLYFFSDDDLQRMIVKAEEIMDEADDGAPDLAPVITTMHQVLRDRAGEDWSLT